MRRRIQIVRFNIQIDHARMIQPANQGRVEGSCHSPDRFASRVHKAPPPHRLPTSQTDEILLDLPVRMGSQNEQR
ncbi:hypothetical protein B0G57_103307 [Trinickia symbiotica]|nr:hypothetical protein B0G57_103307 [Trinickia symbiotica]